MPRMRWLALVMAAALLLGSSAQGVATSTGVRFTAAGDMGMSSNAVAVLDAINSSVPDAHFALGDLAYTTAPEQDYCDMVTGKLGGGFPFELLAGNHESNGLHGHINNFSACLPNQLPGAVGTYGRQYYVDVPQENPLVRHIMISPGLTFPDGSYDYSAGTPRYNWTAAAIDSARAAGIPWVVVGMHKPCLSAGTYSCDAGADIVNLLLSKKVDVVLSGHEHVYQRTKQLALGSGCASLTIGSYNENCVVDADSSLAAGRGTVFVTIGTSGTPLRDVNTADAEWPYFVASSGANMNPTWGVSDFDVTPERMLMQFRRAAGGDFLDAFSLTKSAPENNAPPEAAMTATTDGLTASLDGGASTDSDGLIVSFDWEFGDGSTAAGRTVQHTYAQAGTYTVTLTVTDDGGASASTTKDITVESPPPPTTPTLWASDTFERSLTSGWGTADKGGSWTAPTATGVASVSGGRGQLSLLKAAAIQTAHLPGITPSTVDMTADISLDKIPTGKGAYTEAIALLRKSGSNQYRAQVRIISTGAVRTGFYKWVSGVGGSQMGSVVTVSGLTYAVGDTLKVRAQMTGSAPTSFKVKVWKAGTTEPIAWVTTASDSEPGLQTAGPAGLAAYLSSSATNAPVAVRYDNLSIQSVP